MSNFYRLSITEGSTLELVVELPDHLSFDPLEPQLNRIATDAVKRRYVELHETLPRNFPSLFRFKFEPYANFNPDSVAPGTTRYASQNGVRVWITRPTSMLVY